LIACQCKKNQTDFKAWTISDLGDELDKASSLLVNNHNAEVRFYSRNNFGVLGKLREHSSTQNNETSYRNSLGIEHQVTDATLSARLVEASSNLSTYEFLRRTKFVTSEELDRMETLLRERLRSMASNSDAAFNALWLRLDQLGSRMDGNNFSAATQHRLTKDDLNAILRNSGAMLAPPMNLAEVRLLFSSTSAIGRSWRREIGKQRIVSPTVDELLAAIDSKKRSILLTGMPGSGKTCVMLTLQEKLEERALTQANIVPLFIQSREFADLVTAQDRQAQGLSEQWIEKTARLAEDAHVIVVIDSLDVLSIARDHRVLTYFLAQIDRLLLIQNVTVVTACRDFDRHYDRRIAERQWDYELKCQPMDWVNEIMPLLDKLGIATVNIDAVTRDLITNPRELALFVELAKRSGSFNIVTSQALAYRYLDTIVRADTTLGNAAIQAIEGIATEMLKMRSLVVPNQRFTASQDIQRALCSLNVLQETQDGKLMFGHQTLLDVLVISGRMRNSITLSEFIQSLPPIPFVRPSIRSFVAQLASGERREFRKQIRTALTGSTAFHIKRLVAESFSEQVPQDEDWSLIRDLRENHTDVFQVIYACARATEWHYFWLKYLVPVLKVTGDNDGLSAHVHRIAQWSNEDCEGVLSFWKETLSLEWFDGNGMADRLGIHLSEIRSENIALVVPLVTQLLDMRRSEHSFLGRVIARCLEAGVEIDTLLWRYIADEIRDEDLLGYRFDKKLHCNAHEFGNQNRNFICERLEQSNTLLDLVIDAIEHWSDVRQSHYGETRIGYRHGFLDESSYKNVHSQNDINHADSMNILLDAVETAILHHANTNSDWWLRNRDRLCFSREGALLYFAINACAASPATNVDLIGRMLCDKNMLEFDLDYELSSLMHLAFNLLDVATQDAVMATILTVWDGEIVDESYQFWILQKRVELIVSIPCYQRSSELQLVLDAYEKKEGALIRQPYIFSHGGMVGAPFSFEVFLNTSESGILRLLEHYKGQSDWHGRGVDFLIGGERQVGGQLREACSRHPVRFLSILTAHWVDISEKFRDDIMDGVATYLAYRYGNLQPNGAWKPVEEPDARILANQILNELERHQDGWQYKRCAAKALSACAYVIQEKQEADRLVFLIIGFAGFQEDDPIKGENVDLISKGINMAKGDVTEALMTLTNKFLVRGEIYPELLIPTLRRFARDVNPAVRALVLRHLPYLQSKTFDLGWELFHLAVQDGDGLWKIAEPCLYYAYHTHFEVVKPILARLYQQDYGNDLGTWGRISALACLTLQTDFSEFLEDLSKLNKAEAWRGASMVWSHPENFRRHQDQCVAGISSGFNAGGVCAKTVAEQMEKIFQETSAPIIVPIELIRSCFSIVENDDKNKHRQLYRFHDWLNATSQIDPLKALDAAEIYLDYVKRCKLYLYDHDNSLTQLMTCLFSESEEREESDDGAMLQRVVVIQDCLLSLGVSGVDDWLKAAERP